MNDLEETPICCLTIAGSDSSAGAGIQADLKTFSALGCYGMTVITALTAQNTMGVHKVAVVSPDMLQAQLQAVLQERPPQAIKMGMLADAAIIQILTETFQSSSIPIVLDPVMLSTSGHRLLEEEAMTAMQNLIPLAQMITPNLPEAELLIGHKIPPAAMQEVAVALGQKYETAVLLKGGHLEGNQLVDVLYISDKQECISYRHPKINTPNIHGTGCTLSSAIAAHIALGHTLEKAVALGIKYLQKAIQAGASHHWQGNDPVDHFFNIKRDH